MKKSQEQTTDQVEAPWRFEIGQQVRDPNSGATGEIVWRRENQSGERDYLVKIPAMPDTWIAEGNLEG